MSRTGPAAQLVTRVPGADAHRSSSQPAASAGPRSGQGSRLLPCPSWEDALVSRKSSPGAGGGDLGEEEEGPLQADPV